MKSPEYKERWHNHCCDWCNRYYRHKHPARYDNHKQFKGQCPYMDCTEYHKGKNTTDAFEIGKPPKIYDYELNRRRRHENRRRDYRRR